MNTERNSEPEEFSSRGERLSHILDKIGFKEGRGRVADFRTFLVSKKPDVFEDLKYTTVRAWFQDSAPPMVKVDVIIDALVENYQFHHGLDLSLIKTWWKAGGYYPFVDSEGDKIPSIPELQQEAKNNEDRLQFIVMSLVTDVTGDSFNTLSSDELVRLKDSAIQFARDFADPFKTECPTRFLRMIIQDELTKLSNKKEGE